MSVNVTNTWYVVSEDPDMLTWSGGWEDVPQYETAGDATEAIMNGHHDPSAPRTLHVLKVTTERVAVATRSWELRRNGAYPYVPPKVFGGLYDPPSPTGPGV